MPPITVLMPAHNAGPYLREAMDSVLGQTFRDFEFLIVDDASTDDTPAIVRAFRDERVRYVRSDARLRLAGALNQGLELARGAVIARMDADDICLPVRLAVQHAYLSQHLEVGLCGAGVERFGLQRGPFHRMPLTYAETQAYALFDDPFAHPTVALRRDLFNRHRLRYDPAYCPADDYELWSRALRLFPCVNLDRIVLRYRVHGQSLTQAEWSDMDAHAARVAARELQSLGVAHDGESTRFHRNIGRGRGFPIRRRDELLRAEHWLRTLQSAAESSGRYQTAALRRTVADIWFRACYHAGALGLWALRSFAVSPLRHARRTSVREWLALARGAAIRSV